MIGLASFRDGVGADWDAYSRFYQNTEDSGQLEVGYAFINAIFASIGAHFNVFQFAITTACIALIASSFRYFGAFTAVAVLIFYSDLFLYYNLSGVRQAIAIAITCFALRYVIAQRPVPFFSLVTLAASFHLSAVVFAISYFVPKTWLKWYQLVCVCLAGLALFQFLDPIAQFITDNTLKNASYYLYGIETQDDKLTSYITGGLRRLATLGIILMTWNHLKNISYSIYLLNMYILGLAIYFLFYIASADIGVRMSSYFIIIETMLVGLAVLNAPRASTRFGIACLISFFSLYKLWGYADNPYYEYQFIFQ